MDNDKIEILLNQLLEGQKDITIKVDRIEKKLDGVVAQTADLTEFRTETKEKLQKIHSDLTAVEVVTSKNWNDIATLRIVK
jgi:peptidoglycan hydrolase CwlO-like protein